MHTYAKLADLFTEVPGQTHNIAEFLSTEYVTEDIPLVALVLSYEYDTRTLRMNLDLQTVDDFAIDPIDPSIDQSEIPLEIY